MTNSKSKEHLVMESLELLNKRCSVGLYVYMIKHMPEIFDDLRIALHRINSIVINDGSNENLKDALRDYWFIQLKCIDEFNASTDIDDSMKLEPRQQYH